MFLYSGCRVFKRFLSDGEQKMPVGALRKSRFSGDTGCWKKWIKNQTINKNSASSINHSVHNSIKLSFVLILEFLIFPAEALNASGCVNKLLFAGEKWMAF